jgi:hypothetical protein
VGSALTFFFHWADSFCLRLRKAESQVFLESIIATPALSDTVIDSLTSQLIKVAVESEDEAEKNTIARRLLSLIHQRHPRSLRTAANLLSEEEESSKDVLDQLVFTLSTVTFLFLLSGSYLSEPCDRSQFQASRISVKEWISSFRPQMLMRKSGRWL